MIRKLLLLSAFLLLFALLLGRGAPAAASPPPQAFYQTPTAGPDGRIYYIVQENDTCSRIFLLTNVTVDQLIALNRLDSNCTIVPGQKLLLGVMTEPSPTPGPSPTPEPTLPTPTPFKGNAEICILLFEDKNGNAMPDGDESQIAGGAVSMTDRAGMNSFTGITHSGDEPLCFSQVPEGDYNISVAPPEGMNPTTNMNYPLEVKAGDRSTIDFGAQESNTLPQETPDEQAVPRRSPLLGILGGLMILAGIGLGGYFWWMRR